MMSADALLQRSHGQASVAVRLRDGNTVLDDLHQHANAKIRLPRSHDGICEAVLVNTAGGIAGGDSLVLNVQVGRGAHLVSTTQACERVYRSGDGVAGTVINRVQLDAGSTLFWLPQETILFDNARLIRRLDISMKAGARLLAMETVILGRALSGEHLPAAILDDRWRIYHQDRLIHAEHTRLDVTSPSIDKIGQLYGCRVVSTILFVGCEDGETIKQKAEAIRALQMVDGVSCGVSAFSDKLVCRLAARNSYNVRQAIPDVLAAIVPGMRLPKVWQS